MRHGYLPNPVLRPAHTETRELAHQSSVRTRISREDVSSMTTRSTTTRATGKVGSPQRPSSERKSQRPSTLLLPQASSDFHVSLTRPKSPAYLQGKNPYGQILETGDHPQYHVPEIPTVEPPFQRDSSIEGRSIYCLHFKTRPVTPGPEQLTSTSSTQLPMSSSKQPPKALSVRDATKLFEDKVASKRTRPAPLPRAGSSSRSPSVGSYLSGLLAESPPIETGPPQPFFRPMDVSYPSVEYLTKIPAPDIRAVPLQEPEQRTTIGTEKPDGLFSEYTPKPLTAAELDQTAPVNLKRPVEDQCTESNRKVRRGSSWKHSPDASQATKHALQTSTHSAPVEYGRKQARGQAAQSTTTKASVSTPLYRGILTYQRDIVEQTNEIVATNFGHDGSSSDFGNQESCYSDEVPDHVDWRGAYGRRNTQDFGFPGAHIKPRGTFRTYQPLQEPGDWAKRACGHFSRISSSESQQDVAGRPCRQCLMKISPPQKEGSKYKGSRKTVTTESSTGSPSTHKKSADVHGSPRRRYQHFESVPSNQCGDTFAKDLGHVIDAILDEHTKTLQTVINNINFTQPSLVQLRKVSDDLIQQCQTGGMCPNPCALKACSPTCQTRPPTAGERCSYIPPKAVEKLNVGRPGQVGPNMNDSRSSLRASTKSVAELLDLVNSAADDLGVDLAIRPSRRDDEKFRQAPEERAPRQPETIEEEPFIDDTWLQETRKQLTNLSKARNVMLDELDSIAKDLGVQLQERRISESRFDPARQVLDKNNTGRSRKYTPQRNRSIDSAMEKLPKILAQQVDTARLIRVLAHIQTRTSALTHGLRGLEEVPPGDIQQWLEVARLELPTALDAITTVLETLPAVECGTPLKQDKDAPEDGYYQECVELSEEFDYEDYIESPPQQSKMYTGPVLHLQDRIADHERRLSRELAPIISSSLLRRPEPTRHVRTSSERITYKPVVMRKAEAEVREEVDSPVIERTTMQQRTSSATRRSAEQSVRFPLSAALARDEPEEQPVEHQLACNATREDTHSTSRTLPDLRASSDVMSKLPTKQRTSVARSPLSLERFSTPPEEDIPGEGREYISRRSARRRTSSMQTDTFPVEKPPLALARSPSPERRVAATEKSIITPPRGQSTYKVIERQEAEVKDGLETLRGPGNPTCTTTGHSSSREPRESMTMDHTLYCTASRTPTVDVVEPEDLPRATTLRTGTGFSTSYSEPQEFVYLQHSIAARRPTVDSAEPKVARRATTLRTVTGLTTSFSEPHEYSAMDDMQDRTAPRLARSNGVESELPRRDSTTRTTTGFTNFTISSSEPDSVVDMQHQTASHRPTLSRPTTPTESTTPVTQSSQETTRLEDPSPSESVPEIEKLPPVDETEFFPGLEDSPSIVQSGATTPGSTETQVRIPASRRPALPSNESAWSTEAVENASLADDVQDAITPFDRPPSLIRAPTTISSKDTNIYGQPTRLSPQSPIQELLVSAPASRQTATSSSPPALSEPVMGSLSQAPASEDYLFGFVPVNRMARGDIEPEPEVAKEAPANKPVSESITSPSIKKRSTRISTRSSTLDLPERFLLGDRRLKTLVGSRSLGSHPTPSSTLQKSFGDPRHEPSVNPGPTIRAEPLPLEPAPSRPLTHTISRRATRGITLVEPQMRDNLETVAEIPNKPSRVATIPPVSLVRRSFENPDRSEPPQEPIDSVVLDSYHDSVLDDLLAIMDTIPRRSTRALKRQTASDGCSSAVDRSVQHEPTTLPTSTTHEGQPTLLQYTTQVAPRVHLGTDTYQQIAERQPAAASEEVPEQEPGRVTTSPTAHLSREPDSLAPDEATDAVYDEALRELRKNRKIRVVGEPPETGSDRPHRKHEMNSVPEIDRVLPSVLTVPSIPRERKMSSAPGIMAPPVQAVSTLPPEKSLAPTTRPAKRRKIVNFPPSQQDPPAPEYPVRDTPAWTKPDTHTPPPRPKAQTLPKPKKRRGIFKWVERNKGPRPASQPAGSKHRDFGPPVQSPEPFGMTLKIASFRFAASALAPEYQSMVEYVPRGTPQGTREHPSTPRRNPTYPNGRTAPMKRDDYYPPGNALDSARKEDYYARLPPLIPRFPLEGEKQSQRHLVPVGKDAYRQPTSVRRDSTRAVKHVCSAPRLAPPRIRPDHAPHDQADPSCLLSEDPEAVCHQVQTGQSFRDQATTTSGSKTFLPLRGPQVVAKEPVRSCPVLQEQTFTMPARRDIVDRPQAKRKTDSGRTRSRQVSEARGELSPAAQEQHKTRKPKSATPRASSARRPPTSSPARRRSPLQTAVLRTYSLHDTPSRTSSPANDPPQLPTGPTACSRRPSPALARQRCRSSSQRWGDSGHPAASQRPSPTAPARIPTFSSQTQTQTQTQTRETTTRGALSTVKTSSAAERTRSSGEAEAGREPKSGVGLADARWRPRRTESATRSADVGMKIGGMGVGSRYSADTPPPRAGAGVGPRHTTVLAQQRGGERATSLPPTPRGAARRLRTCMSSLSQVKVNLFVV
ncbi:hypothetical protein BDV95DRAFT_647465 [Massariosphaeria phaeospora]|uniref:Uncharacterized protein n=1 Tax=Massariosphaeria phaeospora TaxID=100035 RepID=A0A7C8I091_9PLEO|nr:hypothetical protein BDV95DRAFT_647465 [Massariosphaeria phaeospora]